jgi:hypothetical protein
MTESTKPPYESTPVELWLVTAFETVFSLEFYTPDNFLKAFPPADIVKHLSARPDLRGNIFMKVLGMPRLTSERIKQHTAVEVLVGAVETGDATAERILEALNPADIAHYFPKQDVWAFITSKPWWKEGDVKIAKARECVLTLITHALSDSTLTAAMVVEQISLDVLGRDLPEKIVRDLFVDAGVNGFRRQPFTSDLILKIATPRCIVESVDLAYLYEKVLHHAASRYGLVSGVEPASTDPEQVAAAQRRMRHAAKAPEAAVTVPTPRPEPGQTVSYELPTNLAARNRTGFTDRPMGPADADPAATPDGTPKSQ